MLGPEHANLASQIATRNRTQRTWKCYFSVGNSLILCDDFATLEHISIWNEWNKKYNVQEHLETDEEAVKCDERKRIYEQISTWKNQGKNGIQPFCMSRRESTHSLRNTLDCMRTWTVEIVSVGFRTDSYPLHTRCFIAYTVAYLSINHLSIHFVVICRLRTPHCMWVDTHWDRLYFM